MCITNSQLRVHKEGVEACGFMSTGCYEELIECNNQSGHWIAVGHKRNQQMLLQFHALLGESYQAHIALLFMFGTF